MSSNAPQVIIPNMSRGMHQAAFGSRMNCPHMIEGQGICGASNWKFVEKISAYRIRYRCGKCNRTVIYEFMNNPGHPYETYGKGWFKQLVERWKHKMGTRPLAKA